MKTTLPASSGAQSLSAQAEGLPLSFDSERYRRHVAHLDMSEERKTELLYAVWDIMRSFVDRAFGDDPTQLARKDGDEIQVAREARLSAVISSADHNNPGERALRAAFQKGAGRGRRKEKRSP